MLDIEKNNFSGKLFFDELYDAASTLQKIRASFNQFSGEIPDRIGEFTNLDNLWLAGNNFEGKIPDEIGDLTNMGECR